MIGTAASFDLVFSRLTLMHQPDPSETLRRFNQLLRPGGAVVAFDLFEPPVTDPGYPPLHNAWRLLLEGMQRRGAHPETSRRYDELVRVADLEVVSQRGVFFPVPPIVTLSETTMLLGAARRSLIASDVIAEEDLDDLIAQLTPARAALRFATTPFAIELVARKT